MTIQTSAISHPIEELEAESLKREAGLLAPALSSMGLCLLFLVVYGMINTYTSTRADVGSFRWDWEMKIPFIAWMIAPYMSLDLFFVSSPFFCQTSEERSVLVRRIAFAILFSGICFLLFPLKCTYVKPDHVDGALGWVFANFLAVDKPFNQCPSLHIVLSGILAPHFARRAPKGLKPVVYAWFGLIAVSTLFTYQHHLIDVIGGALLALLVFKMFPEHPQEDRVVDARRIGLYYAVAAATLIWVAFTLKGLAWFLFWPAVSAAAASFAYVGLGSWIYQKKNGCIPFLTKVLLAPQILGQWISWKYYSAQSDAYQMLVPNVWMGRKLSDAEARSLVQRGVTAVLDLTCELDEASAFLVSTVRYLNIQILDLTAPTQEQLERAVEFIKNESARGHVYVHCKAGYSRTAAILGPYLLAVARARSADEAMQMLRRSRPKMVIRREAEHVIRKAMKRKEAECGNPLRA
jgi:protein-tyrosine phosphatase/membrane-associated phospholipid phosphatase